MSQVRSSLYSRAFYPGVALVDTVRGGLYTLSCKLETTDKGPSNFNTDELLEHFRQTSGRNRIGTRAQVCSGMIHVIVSAYTNVNQVTVEMRGILNPLEVLVMSWKKGQPVPGFPQLTSLMHENTPARERAQTSQRPRA